METKNRPCDFCQNKNDKTGWYYYHSVVYRKNIKVCLCEKCANEDENVKGKIEEGRIRWRPENT